MKFKNDIEAQAGFKDAGGDLGAAGQLLSSTGTETNWIDQSTIASGSAEVVEVPVKNLQGSALTKGDPVYISGSVGASGILEVQLADAGNAAKMPAVGLLKQDLAANAQGFAVVTGKLRNLITSPIDGVTPNPNTVVYVKSGGSTGAALTTVKPGGSTNFIQNVGKVGRVSTSSDGTLVVSSILRSNDVPNLPLGRLFVGTNTNTSLTSDVVYIDDANDRVGIGTPSPVATLDAVGNAVFGSSSSRSLFSGTVKLMNNSASQTNLFLLQAGVGSAHFGFKPSDSKLYIVNSYSTGSINDTTSIVLDTSGNVGIGTTSPAVKLAVYDSSTPKIHLQNTSSGSLDSDGFQLALSGTNGYLWNYENGSMLFATNATERMRIDSTGNVGIGTTSPAYKLDVSGDGIRNIRATAGWAGWFENTGSSSGVVVTAGVDSGDAPLLIRKQDGTELFSVRGNGVSWFNNGNVGIGTTSPAQKLDVVGKMKISDDIILAQTNGRIDYDNGVSSGALRFFSTSGNSERMRITSAGGISFGSTGTAYGTSGQILKSNANASPTWVDASTVIGGPYLPLTAGASYPLTGDLYVDGGSITVDPDVAGSVFTWKESDSTTVAGELRGYANRGDIYLYSNGIKKTELSSQNDSFIPALHIGGTTAASGGGLQVTGQGIFTGNVGIGTTSPSTKLHVNGDIGAYTSDWVATVSGSRLLMKTFAGTGDTYSLIQAQDVGGNSNNALVLQPYGDNVGIGTTSPLQKLHVSGNARVTGAYYDSNNSAGTSGQVLSSTATGTDWVSLSEISGVDGTGTTNYVAKWADTDTITDSVIYDNGTDVGIGTTNPGAKLDIIKSSLSEMFRLSNTEANATTKYGAILGRHYTNAEENVTGMLITSTSSATGGTVSIGGGISAANAANNVLFYTAANNTTLTGTERMRITPSGNVGIGTTSPGAPLDVAFADNSSPQRWSYGPSEANYFLELDTNIPTGSVVTYNFNVKNNGTTYNNNLVLDRGNVGIGTDNPTATLDINAQRGAATNLASSKTAAGFDLNSNTVGGTNSLTIGETNQGSYFLQHANSAGTTAYNLALNPYGGNVGIGTTSPSQKLEVNGNAIIGGGTLDNPQSWGKILQVQNTGSNGAGISVKDSNNEWNLATYSGVFYISDGIEERIIINSSGNATFAGTVTAPTFLGDLNGTINTVTTAVTKANSTNDTTVATTAFVQNLIGTIPAGLVFQGTWNADTNTPTLTSGTGTTGNFYIVSVDGSTNLDGITDWKVGDWAVFVEQGASDQWEKVDNSSVLDGSGTGQTVALWSGSGTSNTLTDSRFTQTSTSNQAKAPAGANTRSFEALDSSGNSDFHVLGTGEVVIPNNYLFVSASQGAYFTGNLRARGGISNDLGTLSLGGNGDIGNLTLTSNTGAAFAGSVTATSALLQSASTSSVVDILNLYNPSQASSGVRQKFSNGYGDLAAIKVSQRDNGALADDGQIEFQVASNASLDTKLTILNTGAIKFNSYSSTNNTGTPTYLLGTDASGNVVKTLSTPSPITSQAASLYDLIPNGAFTTTYAFTSTAGVYAEVMEGNDVITATGTYLVQVFVSDYAVGGTQYVEYYSGVMSWYAAGTNDNGGGAISEISLHRAGHAANQGVIYLRTRETTAPDNVLKLEVMCNITYTGASNLVFKFVRLI